jgi:hypothetical protein
VWLMLLCHRHDAATARRSPKSSLVFCSALRLCALLQYKAQLSKIKEDAVETMDSAKRREGLDFIQVDVASLKPKL